MKVSNVTYENIIDALRQTNVRFSGNVIINNHSFLNQKGTRHRVTLRVKDSKGSGHRLGFTRNNDGNRRRLVSACWHVYGTFVDAIFEIAPDAKVSNGVTGKMDTVDSWYWHDRQIGSMMDPIMYSDACDCDR